MDIYEILEKIRRHPCLYLKAENLTYLNLFIDGYRLGLQETKHVNERLYPLPFEMFTSYCAVKYHETRSIGYERMLLEECGQNQKRALWRFFEVLDEFKENVRITECEVCDLTEENIRFHLTNRYVVKTGIYQDGNWTEKPAYSGVGRMYHISFSYGADLLIPVSDCEHVRGELFYCPDREKHSHFRVFENMEEHMNRCFGNTAWRRLELNEDQQLSLLNDYFYGSGKTTEKLEGKEWQ